MTNKYFLDQHFSPDIVIQLQLQFLGGRVEIWSGATI